MATVKEYDALSPCGTLSDVPMEDVCELRVFTDDGTLYVEDYRKI